MEKKETRVDINYQTTKLTQISERQKFERVLRISTISSCISCFSSNLVHIRACWFGGPKSKMKIVVFLCVWIFRLHSIHDLSMSFDSRESNFFSVGSLGSTSSLYWVSIHFQSIHFQSIHHKYLHNQQHDVSNVS